LNDGVRVFGLQDNVGLPPKLSLQSEHEVAAILGFLELSNVRVGHCVEHRSSDHGLDRGRILLEVVPTEDARRLDFGSNRWVFG
jgi:hypothetical protein